MATKKKQQEEISEGMTLEEARTRAKEMLSQAKQEPVRTELTWDEALIILIQRIEYCENASMEAQNRLNAVKNELSRLLFLQAAGMRMHYYIEPDGRLLYDVRKKLTAGFPGTVNGVKGLE